MANLTRFTRNGRFLHNDPFALAREFFAADPWPAARREAPVAYKPTFNVKETEAGYFISADLPGVADEDLEVSLSGRELTISGKRDEEKREDGDNFHVYERSFGSFSRTFILPDEADGEAVSADLKDGVLSVNIAKKAQAQPRKIAVQK